MATEAVKNAWTGERLTPWVLFDLERIAWVLELRADELSEAEREVVRTACSRLVRAVSPREP
jgi:hypothetical protein